MNVRFVEPLFPSATRGESIDSDGPESSSVIVPVPVAVPMAALTALLSVTTTVSSASSSVSPITETSKVWLVVPAAKVRAPAVMAV